MSSCRKRENIVKISFRTGYRETSTRAFIGRERRFRFPFYPPSANKTRTSHERNLGSSLGFIKFQNSDPLCPFEFRDPPGFSLQKPGKTCTRGNAEFLKFNYASLVSFFSLSPFLPPLSVYVRLTKKGEKKLFRLFRRKFSTKYFSRHGGCLASPVARKGFGRKKRVDVPFKFIQLI